MTAMLCLAEDGSNQARSEIGMRRIARLYPKVNLLILMNKKIIHCLLIIAFCLVCAGCGKSGSVVRVDATEGVCPVCQMKVKVTDPTASEIVFSDGNKLMFETAGDMIFFVLSQFEKEEPSELLKGRGDIEKLLMKDYNSKSYIDASKATLVHKSKINGPMGPEVFAFEKEEDARSFAEANGGSLTTLNTLTLDEIRNLRKR